MDNTENIKETAPKREGAQRETAQKKLNEELKKTIEEQAAQIAKVSFRCV